MFSRSSPVLPVCKWLRERSKGRRCQKGVWVCKWCGNVCVKEKLSDKASKASQYKIEAKPKQPACLPACLSKAFSHLSLVVVVGLLACVCEKCAGNVCSAVLHNYFCLWIIFACRVAFWVLSILGLPSTFLAFLHTRASNKKN